MPKISSSCNPTSPDTIKPDRLRSAGWYAVFTFIPLGNSLLGMFILLAAKIRDFVSGKRARTISKKPLSAKIFQILFLVLYCSTIISAVFSPKRDIAFLATLGFFLVTSIFISEGFKLGFSRTLPLKNYIAALLFGSIAAAVIALFKFYLFHMKRLTSLFTPFNPYAAIIVLSSGIILGCFYQRKGIWRFWMAVYFSVIIPALILTKSRGAWAGLMAMLVCFAAFNRKMIAILLIMLLVVGLVFFNFPALTSRLMSSFSTEENISRIYIWQSSLRMFRDYPILGVGAGAYPFVFDRYAMPGSWERHVSHAHNLFLQVATEFGLIGFVIFITILGIMMYQSFFLARLGNHFYQAIFATLIGILVHCQVDVPIWNMDIAGVFWTLAGLVVGAYCFEKSQLIHPQGQANPEG